MQPWQINVLKLEELVFDDLSGFIREQALYFLVAIMCLMVVLLAWVLSGGLRRRFKQRSGNPPVIVIQSPAPPPAPAPFDPFPPLRDCDCGHDPDEWED